MLEKVGETAGRIWQYLEKNGEVSGLKLKTDLKTPSNILCMGIGWLAREDKLNIKEGKKDFKISLK